MASTTQGGFDSDKAQKEIQNTGEKFEKEAESTTKKLQGNLEKGQKEASKYAKEGKEQARNLFQKLGDLVKSGTGYIGDGVRYVQDAINGIPVVGDVTKQGGNLFNGALIEVKKLPYIGAPTVNSLHHIGIGRAKVTPISEQKDVTK